MDENRLPSVGEQEMAWPDRAATWIVDNQTLIKIGGAALALWVTYAERKKLRASIERLESKIDRRVRRKK
jgi:hypothetical protein